MNKLVFTLMLAISAKVVAACVCLPVNEVAEFNDSDYVGKVFVMFKSVSLLSDGEIIHYVIPVEEYKSPINKAFKVVSNINSSCGFEMDSNSLWILNASYNRNRELWTGQCTGTTRLEPIRWDISNYSDFVKEHKNTVREKLEMLDAILLNKLFDSSNSLFYAPIEHAKVHSIPVSENNVADSYQSILVKVKYGADLKIKGYKVIKESEVVEINDEIPKILSRQCSPIDGVVLKPNKNYNLYLQVTYIREDELYTLFQIKF